MPSTRPPRGGAPFARPTAGFVEATRIYGAERDALRADAERYRWMKATDAWRLLKYYPSQRPYVDACEVFDKAVDAARAALKGER